MRVAIVHDWLVGGGAERVVEQLHKMFPEAPIYTAYCSPEWQARLAPARIVTSYMQAWPFSRLRKLLPALRMRWFARLRLDEYDLVISSSGAEAKFATVQAPAVHIAYIHAPTHYYWSRYEDYLKNPGFGWADPLARWGLKLLIKPLRRRDYQAAQRPNFLVANSHFTARQIKKYYGRTATVIQPPVDVEAFAKAAADQTRRGFVTAGRMTPYKRLDLAVSACTKLNLPLTVIGSGPDAKKLQKLGGPTIRFLGWVTDTERPKLFAGATGFIFPGADDFGITAVEALAAGTPVIALRKGGALDYVNDKTGLFFDEPTTQSLAAALAKFPDHKFNHAAIVKSANQFSATHFRDRFKKFIGAHV